MPLDDKVEKEAFAAAWLRLKDPWEAARDVVGIENSGRALFIYNNWPKDEYVLQKKAEFLGKSSYAETLKSKLETAEEAYFNYQNAKRDGDKHKFLKLYSDIMGYIEKDSKANKAGITVISMSDVDEKL